MIVIEDAHDLAKRNSGPLNKPKVPLTVGQLELALLKRYPREDAEPWDRMGLLVGDPAALVTGVAVALDPTHAALQAAEKAGANVLLTHHPAFLDPPTSFAPASHAAGTPGALVYDAIERGIALMNVHTALDVSPEATRMFARMLNFQFKRLLNPLSSDAGKGYGIVCEPAAGDAPFKLVHLAARATSVFGRPPRVWGDPDLPVRAVVIGNGSANSLVDSCIAAGVDCLVCGEVGYHRALAASQAGLGVVELGHDVSEFPLCALLAQAAAEAGISQDALTMVDQHSNWRYPEAVRM